MRTATRTITYYDGDDDEREKGKTVVRSDGWFKLFMMDWDVRVQCETKMKEGRKAIKRLGSRACVWAMTHPSKHPTAVMRTH